MRNLIITSGFVLILLIIGCEKNVITDLTVRNRAFDGKLLIDSIYQTDLEIGGSEIFILDPGYYTISLVGKYGHHEGYVKSDEIRLTKGRNTHEITLCAGCH